MIRYTFLMMMMVLLLVVSGCARKGLSTSTTTKVTDSTHVKETVRLVKVLVPGDTVTIETRVECDSVTNQPKPIKIKKKSKQASAIIEINSSGTLTATGVCDSLCKVIEAKDKEILRLTNSKSEVIKEKEVYITRGIDKFCRPFSAIVILLIAAFILKKVTNVFRP